MVKTRTVDGNGNSFDMFEGAISDTLSVLLAETSSPHNIVFAAHSVPINTAGSITLNTIPGSLSGNYYIIVKHRNHIETWSQSISFSGSTTGYNFTDGVSKAWTNNLKLIGPGVYGIYSGDINGDGVVNNQDLILLDSDASIFRQGYRNTDINGDGIVDALDIIITDNNAASFVSKKTP
jgi:hypothetical protein